MKPSLTGKKVAILATDGFERSELEKPRTALREAGAHVDIVSPQTGPIRSFEHKEFGPYYDVNAKLADVSADDYDALLLPGGVMNPDMLRTIPEAVKFVRAFFDAGKPVAAICHGPQLLIEADVVRGRRLTSYPSLQTDLRNAGANWVDVVVAVDENLVTSRKPDDIPQFNEKMIELFAQGSLVSTDRRR
jgi:protease I